MFRILGSELKPEFLNVFAYHVGVLVHLSIVKPEIGQFLKGQEDMAIQLDPGAINP